MTNGGRDESGSGGEEEAGARVYGDASGGVRLRLADDALVHMSVREMNWALRQQPAEVVQAVKERRRLLKNRGYAQGSRWKRVETADELRERKAQLSVDIRRLKRSNSALEQHLDQLRKKRRRLEATASKL